MSDYPEALQRLIEELGRLPGIGERSAERLAIYANMYFARIRGVVEEDFPATARAAGDGLEALLRDYLETYPPSDPSLRRVGRHLPAFLAAAPTAADRELLKELAELEWTMIEAFDASDESPLEPAALNNFTLQTNFRDWLYQSSKIALEFNHRLFISR